MKSMASIFQFWKPAPKDLYDFSLHTENIILRPSSKLLIKAEDFGLKPFYDRLRLQAMQKPPVISLIIPIDCIPGKNTPMKKRSTASKMRFLPRVLFTISSPRSTTYEIAFTKNWEKERSSSSKPSQKRDIDKFSSTSCRNTIRKNLD